ncbi:hypothetical protein [Xanthomonas cerealis]|uniref:hypothetical protein n=1 Tax=Xanthomonas cerealis TaxID=3390025 RepID=UPI0021AF90F8|nr:hypothetical protein [Xanthomonas translucens]
MGPRVVVQAADAHALGAGEFGLDRVGEGRGQQPVQVLRPPLEIARLVQPLRHLQRRRAWRRLRRGERRQQCENGNESTRARHRGRDAYQARIAARASAGQKTGAGEPAPRPPAIRPGGNAPGGRQQPATPLRMALHPARSGHCRKYQQRFAAAAGAHGGAAGIRGFLRTALLSSTDLSRMRAQ